MTSRLTILLVLISSLLLIFGLYAAASHRDKTQWVGIQSGVASWYGKEDQGKRTASGEAFDPHKFTAASRHLPFNTIVRVTNRQNGRSVEVRINDRGPFLKGRVIDVSEAAATRLNMKTSGVAPVEIEVMKPAKALSDNSVLP